MVSFDFIYDLLAPYYPATGRPSVDPVSMFKMLLIGYLYGIKSERRLVEEVQLNIAYRWFCGFELDDTIPNHSTFSKTRTRKWQQSSLFQKAFYEIVKQCIDSGLIDGEAMAADGSYIPANVSRESWINVEIEVEQSMQSYLDSLDEELSNQPGFKKPPTKIVRKCRTTSQTDPDSGYINHGSKRGIGYLMEATVDCKHGILTGVDVYPANEKESVLVLRHLERQINLGIPMSRLALDRGYETGAVHRGLELLGITGYIPAIQFSNPPEKYGFSYDPQLDAFICPEGVPLTYHRLNCSKSTGKYLRCYQVEGDVCMRCPKRPSCFDKAGIRRRVLASSCYPAFFRGHQRVGTPEYLSMMRLRKIWAEGSFSVLKREHCISRIRKRGILAATEECLLAAMALNLKRMVNAIFRYFQIYCSAGTTVGSSRIFAFVNRSLLEHYFTVYLPSSVGVSPNTITSYKYAFKLLLRFLGEKYSLAPDRITFADLNYETITNFLEWLEVERTCSVSTRNQRLAALSAFSAYAQSRSFDAACCFRKDINKIPAKKQGQPTRTAFSLNEVKLLLSLPDTKSKIGLRDRTLLSVMYASGARAQEMCNLTVADVRFDKETATLTLKGKGGKYRHIGIPTAPAKILKQYIVFREIDRCFDKFVFSSQTHAQMTISCVEGIFKKYVSLARKRHPDLFRAKSYSPHSMRHSTATHMLEAGVPLIVIKNFLGHSSLQTTQVYAAVSQCTLNKHIQDWNKKWFSDDGSLEHQLKAEIPSFLI